MKTKFNLFLTLLMVLFVQFIFAQDRVVSGVVSDNLGLPLPGVNVLVKGTKTGVQTDIDGKYAIKVSPNQTLVFSFVGFKEQEAKASSTNLNIKMQSNAVELEGVVVTAIGIKRQKKALGYATANISSKDLTEVNNTNIFESLSGKVAGVDITSAAQTGASTKVVIRGFTNLGSAPLYIVDGTPITNGSNSGTGNTRSYDSGNGIGDIDPNNIESITVLKGGAASALYGSRGSSGVIVITTKSGKNKSKISVETSHSAEFSEVARVPHFQNSFGQGWNGKSWSNWAGQPGNTTSNENGSWGPAFNGEIRPWGAIINNSQQIKPYVALDNNFRDFFDQGTLFNNSVRVSGGGENSNFSISFSDVNADGVVPTNSDALKRRTFSVNGAVTGDKLSFKANMNYVRKDQNAVNTGQGSDSGEGNTATQELLQIPRDISIVDLADYQNNPFNNNDNYFTPYATNPYWTLNENKTFVDGNRLFGNTNVAYKLSKKLSISYQIGGDYSAEKVKSYGAVVRYTPNTPQADAGANAVVGGVTELSTENIELDSNLILNFDSKIASDFNIYAQLGFNNNERKISSLAASITNLDIPYYYELSNSSVKPVVAQNDATRRSYSAFSSIETSYKDRIFLTLTGRNEWTSTLPKGNNSYFYPSVSLSAIAISNSKYFLKLRGAYAKTATDTAPYQVNSGLVQGGANLGFGNINLPIGGVNGYEFGNLGNETLIPEFVREYEFGFESNLFSKRVNLDVSLYNKKTDDILFAQPLPASTGFPSRRANIMDIENKGIELTLNVVPVRTDNFTWEFTTTFTKNKSKVLDIEGESSKILLASNYGVSYNAIEGEPLGVFSTFVPQTTPDGQYIVDPATGFYEVTDDEQNIGTSQRDFILGFKNRVSYKNLTLSFGIDWKQGGEMYSYTKRLSHFTGNGIETIYNDRNPFIIPNSVIDNGDGTYSENTTPISFESITDFYNTQNNPGVEQSHVIDKTFVRLRDMSLTYNLSSKILKGTGLTGTSITVYGKNLALWTPDENPYIDPELSTFGTGLLSEQGEFGANPSQRSYGVSLKLTF